MRRIDAIAIAFGIFISGGIIYQIFQYAGFDNLSAGIWSQVILVGGLMAWLLSYLFRAVTNNMTYHQQVKNYQDAVLQKRLEEMTPEEIAQLQAKVEAQKQDSAQSKS